MSELDEEEEETEEYLPEEYLPEEGESMATLLTQTGALPFDCLVTSRSG
jgi:hypothetical protein